jgi:hypothetical protein
MAAARPGRPCGLLVRGVAPESQTFMLPVQQPRLVRVRKASGITAARRRLWGFLARRARTASMIRAPELDCPAVRSPVRPDPVGSSGMAGAGPTGLR